MLKVIYFAHAEEIHTSTFEELLHYATPWYLALPLFIMVSIIIGYLAWLVGGRKPGTVMLIEAIFLLVSGFMLANISPLVSALAIVVGLLLAACMTLIGLANGPRA
jgi:O-antigen/teichoic acid export membrane protein